MTPVSVLSPVLVLSLSMAGPADRPATREAAAKPVVAGLRAEVEKLSPCLLPVVDWRRLETTLAAAAGEPAPWLARNILLVQVYNLADWPMDERLALLRAFYRDENPAVRLLVVDFISREDAIKAGSLADLRTAAGTDPDPGVRIDAARRLLQRNDPAGWTPILTLLSSDEPGVRDGETVLVSPSGAAKDVLIDFTTHTWGFASNAARLPEPLRLTPVHLKLITKAFAKKENMIRRTAVELIGLNRDPKTFAILKDRAETDPSWTVLRSTFVSLGYLGDPAALPILQEALAKPRFNRTGRMPPALGLAYLGDPGGLKVLVDALGEPGADLPILLKALTRAFDPGVGPAQGEPEPEEETAFPSGFVVPSADGQLVPAWIPAASSRDAPMNDDGRGGKVRTSPMTPAEVRAAWKAFLDRFGSRLVWDKTACRFTVAAKP